MERTGYEEPYVLFGTLLAMGNRLQTLGDKFYEEITTKQWFVLAVLETFREPPTLGQLAQGMGTSHQNAKQLVLRLREKGYVTLAQDAADARKYRVQAAPGMAQAFRARYGEKQRVFMEALFKGIDRAETARALGVLEHLLANMEALAQARACGVAAAPAPGKTAVQPGAARIEKKERHRI